MWGDHEASKEVEIVIGSDNVIRCNVDGVCEWRIRLGPNARFIVNDLREPASVTTPLRTVPPRG